MKNIDAKTNDLIVAFATVFRKKGNSNILVKQKEAILKEYKPGDIKHSLDHISERFNQSPLLRNVLNNSRTYEREVHNLIPFFEDGNNFILPQDYDSRLQLLIEDLNGLKLGSDGDREFGMNIWCKYALNPLSSKEIGFLNKDNVKKIASKFNSNKKNYFKKFRLELTSLDTPYDHLNTRAKRADFLLDNLTQLYRDIDNYLER